MRAEAGPGWAGRGIQPLVVPGLRWQPRLIPHRSLDPASSTLCQAAGLTPLPHSPYQAWSRYGQVTCSVADARGVVGILGPGPFKVRGVRLCPGRLPLGACAWPGTLPFFCKAGAPLAQSGVPVEERSLCQWRFSLNQEADRADRGWDTGLVTYPSLCKPLSTPKSCL